MVKEQGWVVTGFLCSPIIARILRRMAPRYGSGRCFAPLLLRDTKPTSCVLPIDLNCNRQGARFMRYAPALKSSTPIWVAYPKEAESGLDSPPFCAECHMVWRDVVRTTCRKR